MFSFFRAATNYGVKIQWTGLKCHFPNTRRLSRAMINIQQTTGVCALLYFYSRCKKTNHRNYRLIIKKEGANFTNILKYIFFVQK